MDIAGYRLRDHQAGCAGPVTAHRAEVRGRPGRLVRLAWLTGEAAGPRSEALVERWRTILHPALLPITTSERDVAGLLVSGPMASARPLDHLDPDTSHHTIATLARIGTSIAAGLRALHDHGFVHGVVNGHTILLGTDGTAVLDGPWHAGCIPTPRRSDTATAPGSVGRIAIEADDVRALAVTLLDRLEAVAPDEPSPDGDRLRRLLEDQRDRPDSAAALEHALAGWQESMPEPAPAREPAPTPQASPGREPAPRPQRAPGPERSRPPSTPPAQAAAASAAPATVRLPRVALAAAAIAGVLVLGIAGASMRSGPVPSGSDPTPSGSAAAPAGSAAARSGPPPAERSLSSPEPARPGPADATTRPVCPDTIPPPGPGRLLLADLDGRGCRAPVRVDGSRLALSGDDGPPIEVALDLEVGDQVRVGDLDGSGRDEVLVYRPDSGELFRFDGLADPGEERVATGETTPWRGGTAAVIPAADGSDRLEVRGGTPP